jgi:hypothetical protein
VPHVVPDLADQRRVGGVPGPAPDPHRDAVAGDGHADHDLRQVVAVVLGVAEGAEPRVPAVPRGIPAAGVLAAGGVAVRVAGDGLVGVLGLEVGGGRVEEMQVYLKVEDLGGPVEDLLFQGAADLQQPVHRPVAGIVSGLGKPGDQHVLARPPGGGQLRGRRQRPVGGQGEQHPLGRLIQAPARQQPPHRRADAQPRPQRVQHPRAAQRPGLGELQPRRRDVRRLARVQVPGHGGDQAPQRLPARGVLPAEVVDDLHRRPLRRPVPHVVGQLQVPDLAAVLVPPRRRPQVHRLVSYN